MSEIIIRRDWSMPNKWTFRMKPVRTLLKKYNVGLGWIDPFAGENSPAEETNDIDPTRSNVKHNLDALAFLEMFPDSSKKGILLDPPYSFHQMVTMYQNKRMVRLTPIYLHAARILQPGGHAIHFGWNTNGIGRKYGFIPVEVLIIPHGGHHNDTLVLVEQKHHDQLRLFQ